MVSSLSSKTQISKTDTAPERSQHRVALQEISQPLHCFIARGNIRLWDPSFGDSVKGKGCVHSRVPTTRQCPQKVEEWSLVLVNDSFGFIHIARLNGLPIPVLNLRRECKEGRHVTAPTASLQQPKMVLLEPTGKEHGASVFDDFAHSSSKVTKN